MIPESISHYKILDKLGEGGMGIVYKAEDTKLQRIVALKFLSQQALGAEEDRARFVREAQAAAALDHPHICTVFEIDEADGQIFIAMRYIDGKTLDVHIADGPIPVAHALEFARQIAAGLQEAHAHGIVHRDIKSANIMIDTRQQAKITDFGLAKVAGAQTITKSVSTMGTVAYMSPEQGRGEDVDRRSDIWSLGIVLYEMLAGCLPFKGEYEQAVIYSILNVDPKPLSTLRPEVPPEIDNIIFRALAKKVDERYQQIAEFLDDLQALLRDRGSAAANVGPETAAITSLQAVVDPRTAAKAVTGHLFLDASTSMKGFVRAGFTSYFSQTIKELEHAFTRSWPDAQKAYYRFGAKIKKISRQGYRKAITDEFYDAPDIKTESRIHGLFTKSNFFHAGNLLIIATDLFEQDADTELLLQELKKVTCDRGLAVGVIGMRSQYDGVIDAISERNYTLPWQTKGADTYRPCYILLIGSYGNIRHYYQKLESGALGKIPTAMQRFTIFTKDVLFPPISFDDTQIISMSQMVLKGETDLKLGHLVKIFQIKQSPKPPQVTCRFRLQYIPHVLRAYYRKLNVQIHAKGPGSKTFLNDAEVEKAITVQASITDVKQLTMKIEINWHNLPRAFPLFCSVDLTPTIHYPALPDWFTDWNMEEANLEARLKKADEKIGARTYNLQRFLRALTEYYLPRTQQIYFVLRK